MAKTGQRKATREQVEAALRKKDGVISHAANMLKVHQCTIHNYLKEHPDLREVIREAREGVIDDTESALYRAARAGEAWAVCFLLKTQAKHRGYNERGGDPHGGDSVLRAIFPHLSLTALREVQAALKRVETKEGKR